MGVDHLLKCNFNDVLGRVCSINARESIEAIGITKKYISECKAFISS